MAGLRLACTFEFHPTEREFPIDERGQIQSLDQNISAKSGRQQFRHGEFFLGRLVGLPRKKGYLPFVVGAKPIKSIALESPPSAAVHDGDVDHWMRSGRCI